MANQSHTEWPRDHPKSAEAMEMVAMMKKLHALGTLPEVLLQLAFEAGYKKEGDKVVKSETTTRYERLIRQQHSVIMQLQQQLALVKSQYQSLLIASKAVGVKVPAPQIAPPSGRAPTPPQSPNRSFNFYGQIPASPSSPFTSVGNSAGTNLNGSNGSSSSSPTHPTTIGNTSPSSSQKHASDTSDSDQSNGDSDEEFTATGTKSRPAKRAGAKKKRKRKEDQESDAVVDSQSKQKRQKPVVGKVELNFVPPVAMDPSQGFIPAFHLMPSAIAANLLPPMIATNPMLSNPAVMLAGSPAGLSNRSHLPLGIQQFALPQ